MTDNKTVICNYLERVWISMTTRQLMKTSGRTISSTRAMCRLAVRASMPFQDDRGRILGRNVHRRGHGRRR